MSVEMIMAMIFSLVVIAFVAGYFLAPEVMGISKEETPENKDRGDKES